MKENTMGAYNHMENSSMYGWVIGNGVHQVTELMMGQEEEE